MWIRSQDTERLIKVTEIRCFEKLIAVNPFRESGEFFITSIGNYGSLIANKIVVSFIEKAIEKGLKVFEMPQRFNYDIDVNYLTPDISYYYIGLDNVIYKILDTNQKKGVFK
jgi:hypothetical protein